MADPFSWTNQIASAAISAAVSFFVARMTGPFAERRTAQLQRRQSILALIEDISAEGAAYWRSFGQDVGRESLIKTKLDRLVHQLDVFYVHARYDGSKAAMNKSLVELRNMVTGGAFEGIDRQSDQPLSARIKQHCASFAEAAAGLNIAAKLDPWVPLRQRLSPLYWLARRKGA